MDIPDAGVDVAGGMSAMISALGAVAVVGGALAFLVVRKALRWAREVGHFDLPREMRQYAWERLRHAQHQVTLDNDPAWVAHWQDDIHYWEKKLEDS